MEMEMEMETFAQFKSIEKKGSKYFSTYLDSTSPWTSWNVISLRFAVMKKWEPFESMYPQFPVSLGIGRDSF